MNLTPDEHEMLNGNHGRAARKSMEILTTLGNIFHAEGMVERPFARHRAVKKVAPGAKILSASEDRCAAKRARRVGPQQRPQCGDAEAPVILLRADAQRDEPPEDPVQRRGMRPELPRQLGRVSRAVGQQIGETQFGSDVQQGAAAVPIQERLEFSARRLFSRVGISP